MADGARTKYQAGKQTPTAGSRSKPWQREGLLSIFVDRSYSGQDGQQIYDKSKARILSGALSPSCGISKRRKAHWS
ncbi:unnamed protein product [Chrysoparadoxa australica]